MRTPTARFRREEVLTVDYSQAQTKVDAAIGKACPLAVYPDHEDYDYVKVALDPVSLAAMERSLAKIDTSFARQMIWGSLYEMMVDARLSAQEFSALVYTQAATEKESQALNDRPFLAGPGGRASEFGDEVPVGIPPIRLFPAHRGIRAPRARDGHARERLAADLVQGFSPGRSAWKQGFRRDAGVA